MTPTDPLPLTHSWPIFERGSHFDLGHAYRCDDTGDDHADLEALERQGVGTWACELRDETLSWSVATYDLFGLPRGGAVSRSDTVALYAERSRAAMEQLRAHAIKHRRGFTLDAEIFPHGGGRRWVRLVAAPVCHNGRVVRLRGLKRDVSDDYR